MFTFLTDATISQIVQSSACATAASIGWWVLLRLMDRSNGRWRHYRDDVLPALRKNPLALALVYAARSFSVALIWYGSFAAVRTFGMGG